MASTDVWDEWQFVEPVIQGIPHLVVGEMAVNCYGPARYTRDFDLAVATEDGKRLVEALQEHGFSVIGVLSIGGYSLQLVDRTIDVLYLYQPWAQEALVHPKRVNGFPVIDLPYLVLMKFEASHGRDLSDVLVMLHRANEEQKTQITQVFQKYANEDLAGLKHLIDLSHHV